MFSKKMFQSISTIALLAIGGFGSAARADHEATQQPLAVAGIAATPYAAEAPAQKDGLAQPVLDRACKIGPRLGLPMLPASKTRSKTAFALDLLTKVAGDGTADVSVSPFGVSTILAALDLGADAKTKAAIAHALAFTPKERTAAIENLRREARLLGRIGEAADAPFSSADLLLVDHQVQLSTGMADTVLAETGIALRPVDFSSNETIDGIDRWAERQTRGRIPSIMNPGDHPQFAAIDAFVFKDCWRFAFDPSATASRPFTRLDGTSVDRPTMTRRDTDLSYGTTASFYAVELPYADDRFSLTLVAARDPKTPLSGFSAREVRDFLGGRRVKTALVDLSLPKFTDAGGHELTEALEASGLPRGSSFGGFAPGLKLSEMRQKTFVAVDEVGTEAAAVTVGLASRGMPVPSKAVRVVFDHPFLYALRHRQTGVILMIGWVADPSAGQRRAIR